MARYSKRFAANAIVSGCVVCCYVCVFVFVGECVRQSYIGTVIVALTEGG